MSDPRFARIKTDPRFRRPKKKQQKVVVDERFKSVFEKKGSGKAKSVDKYGRKLSKTHEEDNLKKYYRLANGSSDEEAGEVEATPKVTDYARGEVLMESSDEEENDGKGKVDRAEESDSSDVDDIVRIGGDEDELEINLDEDTYAELDAQVAAYAEANEAAQEKKDLGIASRTRRLAVVNLDWDHVRASHLHKIFSSLVSPVAPYLPISLSSANGKADSAGKSKTGATPVARGSVVSVRVYPSEFGKVRMEKEEKEGPPAEIFKKKRKETQEINERTIYEVGDEDEYDEDALRRYQLERLRYYYAIVDCDSAEAASHIYNELEGTELERSANVFDLSFVPDDMTFDAEPRDEATEDVSTNFKPIEYVTDALRHSKVKLTWDDDNPERHQVTRRQLTRQEIEEGDFRAYIASSSSEGEDEDQVEKGLKSKKEASRQKLRSLLLGGGDETLPEGWKDGGERSDVDMEITFTPGLSDRKGEEDETTLEKYQRKVREKRRTNKEDRKEKDNVKLGKGGSKAKANAENDEFFDFGSGNEDEFEVHASTSPKEKGKRSHGDRLQNLPSRKESTVEELALVAGSSNADGQEPRHFNMKAVMKAEKQKGKKKKQSKRNQEENELQEDFEIDTKDDRFKILHEDHEFAIDPTNPHFKKTKGMKALLEERRRRQKHTYDSEAPVPSSVGTVGGTVGDGDKALRGLVESVKRKSQAGHGSGKRRRQ